jgi:hypothetical protein
MYEQVEKPKINKSRAVANSVSRKQIGSVSTFQFVDNRNEFIVQREIQELIGKNSTVRKSPSETAQGQQSELVQRQIDLGKFNVVGEDHSRYNSQDRQAEQQKVTAVFGDGTYHTEDTFSAIPDVAEEASTEEEQDNLQTFASKADPPYYAITQGLKFIGDWCTNYRSFSADRQLLVLINRAQARIEKEMTSNPLKKLEGSDEERDFVLAHDILLARFEQIDDPSYPRENLVGDSYIGYGKAGKPNRNLNQEVLDAVAALKNAAEAYLLKIQTSYAQAKTEFEQFMGITPTDDIVKKRSKTMGFHTMAHAFLGNRGVLKVGEYHLKDFEDMDLGDVTLSPSRDLQEFLQDREVSQIGASQLKTIDNHKHGSIKKAQLSMQKKTMQLKLPVVESLTTRTVSPTISQRVANQPEPVQRLSLIPHHDWKSQLTSRKELRNFEAFAAIVQAADLWDGDSSGEHLEALKSKIAQLGQQLLTNQSDIANVYLAIKRYFPEEYLTTEDISMVKKYNFDGPIAFTAENVMAWLRLANGQGTVDDLRYIHHEIYEIKKIQGTEMESELVKTDPEESFWEEGYEPAHGAALMVEIRFLTHAVNLIYHKNYT